MVLVNRTSKLLLLLALSSQCILYLCSSNVSAQDYVDECPEPNGFYADAVQCDRYYECKDSVVRKYQFNLEDRFKLICGIPPKNLKLYILDFRQIMS